MSAWEGVACGGGKGAFYRLEFRVQDPGPGNPEGDLKSLYAQAGSKISEAEQISKALVCAPVEGADNRYDNKLLSEVCDKLHESV